MRTIRALAILFVVLAGTVDAQVGKSLGVVDANTAAEKDLLAMPHMNAARVKALIEKRPFASITDLNAFLLSQGLTAVQAMEFDQVDAVAVEPEAPRLGQQRDKQGLPDVVRERRAAGRLHA